jgi:hypothetical protein
MPNINIDKTLERAVNFADDSFESREEAENTRTQRQEIDMTSPFRLPHLIRPIMAIWAMAIYSFALIFGMIKGQVDGLEALGSAAAILISVVGFYFNSRKMEKVTAKKAQAAIELEKMKTRSELREERLDNKEQRREDKREAKEERKEERRERRNN